MSTAIRLITADELFLMPDAETGRCELIDGEIIRMSPPGGMHGIVCGRLMNLLSSFVDSTGIGAIVIPETGFIVSRNPDTVLAPDIAFIRRDQIAATAIPRAYFPDAPALAVEVVSPGDTVNEVSAKMRRWLMAGVELAWVVDPIGQTVTVYRAADDIRVLTEKDIISGEGVVPGFECKVAELFSDL